MGIQSSKSVGQGKVEKFFNKTEIFWNLFIIDWFSYVVEVKWVADPPALSKNVHTIKLQALTRVTN